MTFLAVSPSVAEAAELTNEEWWRLYDLVTAKLETVDNAEFAAMTGLGSSEWRTLKDKLRRRLASPAGEGV